MFAFSAMYAQSNLAINHRTPLTDAQQYKMSIDDYTRPVTHKKWVANNKDYRFDYINETFLTSIPATWTVIVDPASGYGWEWENGSYNSYGKGNACANSDNHSGIGVTFLVSPIVDCSGASSLSLEFNYLFKQLPSIPDYGTVEVYNGTSWVILETFNVNQVSIATSYDVSSYKNANFQVRFQYNDGGGGNSGWFYSVSDVRVFSPIDAHDLGVDAITPSIVLSGSTVTPTVTLKNHGSSTEATWTVVLSDGGSYTSTKANLSAISAGASLVVSMDPWTPADNDYTLTATVSNVSGDAMAANDVLTQTCSVSPSTWIATSGIISAPNYLGSSAGYFDGTNHYLYSFGGNTVSTLNTETSIYNIETETWTAGATMPASSSTGCATTAGAYVYVLRGNNGANYTNDFYRYDISANTWSTLASLPAATPIGYTQIAAVDGSIYCVGGVDDDYNIVSNVYRYNIATDTWSTAINTTIGHYGGSLTVVNGKLVYVMGIDVVHDVLGTAHIGTIDSVNPDLITWTVGANTCPTRVLMIKACPWTANKLIVTGGSNGSGDWWKANAASYTYDIVTDVWTPIIDKTTPTLGYAAASFAIGTDMRYYVATGYNSVGSGQLDNVEYFTTPISSVGTDDVVVKSAVSLYPNPTQGHFTIELGSNNSNVTVYNLMGEVISSRENVNGTVPFDLSNVASGIYLVKIVSDNQVIDRKVNVIH